MANDDWQDIATAPYEQPVIIRVEGRTKGFKAILRKDASLTESEQPCDQWQALDQDYPQCWSEGACWTENADGYGSAQPISWRSAHD